MKSLIFSIALSFTALQSPVSCSSESLFETLRAAQLIGSHFGPPSINSTYDYVIVGGGTAGLTLATRLAQNASNTVAVVEAGSFYELTNANFSEVPALAANWIGWDPLLKNPQVDWDQYTEPMPGLGGRSILYTSGKTLGGGSARNYMFYTRWVYPFPAICLPWANVNSTSKGAHQRWADAVGDDSYTYDKFLPYLKRSVEYLGPNNNLRAKNATPEIDTSAFSSTGGPLKVSYPNFATSFGTWVIKGLKSVGYKEARGFVSGNLLGYSYTTWTLDRERQTRSSSETSFLRDALATTTNLNFYTSTLAKKIVFNGTTAQGVLVNAGWQDFLLTAKREVIVSAGTFRSPQLLLASGVGPRSDLEALKIPVVADRPGVGQNLTDHIAVGVNYPVNIVTHSQLGNHAYIAAAAQSYLVNRTGALTSTGGDIIAFEKFPDDVMRSLRPETQAALKANPADWPDVEYFFSDAYAGNNKDFTHNIPPTEDNYVSNSAALASPFSRGYVKLANPDTATNPVVNFNYYKDPRDQDIAIAAFKRIRKLTTQSDMKQILIGPEAFPGANITSDADILKAIQSFSLPVYHASSTCAMGKPTDPYAVVDSKARVIGVKNLRVVDASAFPFLVPGHIQATVYGLAEMVADFIMK
jgi:choline dehydrogenase